MVNNTETDEQLKIRVMNISKAEVGKQSELIHLLAWTRGGRVTAIPRSLLYTERARAELQRVLQGDSASGRMDLHVGIPFELHPMGEGRLVVYDAHALEKSESPEVHRQFIQSLMGLAAIKNPCTMGDPRLEVIGLERRGGGRGVGRGFRRRRPGRGR